MLDIKFIREHADLVKEGARKKRIPIDLDRLLALDEERRKLLAEVESLRAERNRRSKEIPTLPPLEREKAIVEMRAVAERTKEVEAHLRPVEEEFTRLMLLVPNVPAPEVPEGETSDDNVEIKRWGTIPEFDFLPRDHVELGELLDIIDIPRGVKIAGTRSYFLKNEGVLLELAILRFAMDHLLKKGFTPFVVPHLVRDEMMVGTAYFPGGEEQAYRIEKDELSLIGTSEVPITAYHAEEVLHEEELPKYYVGISSCYRREAGTYGKDTRGLFRIHQFQKVEQVVLCQNDEAVSKQEHQHILQNAEEIVQALGFPYRVVHVCGGDLGQPQIEKFDIETWMPSRNNYAETHSASRFHDFQARRLRIRYRTKAGKTEFVHTLNNTAIASPRILIPLLELYQEPDGSVRIPEVLRPYMQGQEKIERKKTTRTKG